LKKKKKQKRKKKKKKKKKKQKQKKRKKKKRKTNRILPAPRASGLRPQLDSMVFPPHMRSVKIYIYRNGHPIPCLGQPLIKTLPYTLSIVNWFWIHTHTILTPYQIHTS
jgi:hypothetical protein